MTHNYPRENEKLCPWETWLLPQGNQELPQGEGKLTGLGFFTDFAQGKTPPPADGETWELAGLIHHALSPEDTAFKWPWKAQGVRSNVDALCPSHPRNPQRLPKGQGIKIEH